MKELTRRQLLTRRGQKAQAELRRRGMTKPQLPAKQSKWRTRVLAETVAWKIIATELEAAANKPLVVLKEHGYWDEETPEHAVKEFGEVLLDVADWFKRGKRLPE